MRIFVRLIRGLLLVLVMAVTALVAWLSLSPPELLKVGTGYAAKIVCSNVFLAGRDANQEEREGDQQQQDPERVGRTYRRRDIPC